MEDTQIVALYKQRDESAIKNTEEKYGRYLLKIAMNILADFEDSKESVNDTYLKAWNSIPPHLPRVLSTFLGKITRQTSIDIYRKRTSQKRQGTQYALSLAELEECIPAGGGPEQEFDENLLAETINNFLRSLPEDTCHLFIGRYYFADPLREVATYCNMSESKAKSLLHRTRLHLKEHLEKEGYTL